MEININNVYFHKNCDNPEEWDSSTNLDEGFDIHHTELVNGDIVVYPDGRCWIRKKRFADGAGEYWYSGRFSLVISTKITRKLYKNTIIKDNEEWLIIKEQR